MQLYEAFFRTAIVSKHDMPFLNVDGYFHFSEQEKRRKKQISTISTAERIHYEIFFFFLFRSLQQSFSV